MSDIEDDDMEDVYHIERRPPGRPKGSDSIKQENLKVIHKVQDGASLAERPTELLLEQADRDPWSGFTDRQRTIQDLKLRGLNQSTISKILGVSPLTVNKELHAIKEIHKKKGSSIDPNLFAGETISIYEELQVKALKTYYSIADDSPMAAQMRLQAINTVANIREKMLKTLGDLGLIQKVPQKIEHEHSIKRPSFVEAWDKKAQENLANNILTAGFEPLPEPELPEEEESDIVEGVVIEERENEEEGQE